ncbi:MAG: hypothetical protein ACYDH2_16570, partial [Anaerolineaceae bacterium]
MENPNQASIKNKKFKLLAPTFRGFTLQLFLIIILPLTVLVLAVAFGSQSLHHEAMRSLVGDRDLRTVRAAASSLEREVSHVSSMIQILSSSLDGKSDFNSLVLTPEEISAIFDGGLALYTEDGSLLRSSSTQVEWKTLPSQIPDFFKIESRSTVPTFSNLI